MEHNRAVITRQSCPAAPLKNHFPMMTTSKQRISRLDPLRLAAPRCQLACGATGGKTEAESGDRKQRFHREMTHVCEATYLLLGS